MNSKKEFVFFLLYLIATIILAPHCTKHVVLFMLFISIAISYPLFHFVYHNIIVRFINFYVKDYIKNILDEIEYILGTNIKNQIITEVVLPLSMYNINDFDQFIDDLSNFLDNSNIDEERYNKLMNFFDSNNIKVHINTINEKRKMEASQNISKLNTDTTFNKLFTYAVKINTDFHYSSILKYIQNNINKRTISMNSFVEVQI